MIQLELQPELEAQLTADAEANGLRVSQFLEKRLVSLYPLKHTQAERDQAVADIRQLRRGNVLGADLTIKDLINEGRKY